MMNTSFSRKFYWFAAAWLLLLFVGSVISPPSLISDPGLGFLDLINFSEGGSFQHHKEPSLTQIGTCVEVKTTWWSPGQWFFIYLFTLPGLPLGVAISVTVLIAVWLGLTGWLRLYRRFQFSETVVLYAGLLILFSRYLFSSFQIYPGANILEFAAAPWFLLLWLWLEKRSIALQAICLFVLLLISYFIKSSMLIFWLAVIGSCISVFQLKQSSWQRFVVLIFVFVAGRYVCDWLFVREGVTPFSFPGKWISFYNNDLPVLFQHFLFTISAPLLATIGADDYIRYVFQKPGSVIFPDGHPAILFMYVTVFLCFLLLAVYFLRKRLLINNNYSNLIIAFTGVFISFFLYTFISGKIINAYEESRHMRLAGLLLLPLAVQYLYNLFKRYLFVLPLLMFCYAVLSSFNKANRVKVISDKYRIQLNEMNSEADYRLFRTTAETSDLVYVIYAGLKYDLDHCKTFYQQDDFISLPIIQSRPKTIIRNKTILFLLPERFGLNGKRDAILANFIAGNRERLPIVQIQKLNNWELIKVTYY